MVPAVPPPHWWLAPAHLARIVLKVMTRRAALAAPATSMARADPTRVPAALELIDRMCLHAVADWQGWDLPDGANALLLAKVDVVLLVRGGGATTELAAFDGEVVARAVAALDVPAYKIASGDLKSTPLLKHVARFGKPMIISTGGASIDDVQRAYDVLMPLNPQLAILQCTAGYPECYEGHDAAAAARGRPPRRAGAHHHASASTS